MVSVDGFCMPKPRNCSPGNCFATNEMSSIVPSARRTLSGIALSFAESTAAPVWGQLAILTRLLKVVEAVKRLLFVKELTPEKVLELPSKVEEAAVIV